MPSNAETKRKLRKNLEDIKQNVSALKQCSQRVNRVARELKEIQKLFNLQYLQLQKKMQDENRKFTMISNIMKARHDTAKNLINNIR